MRYLHPSPPILFPSISLLDYPIILFEARATLLRSNTYTHRPKYDFDLYLTIFYIGVVTLTEANLLRLYKNILNLGSY